MEIFVAIGAIDHTVNSQEEFDQCVYAGVDKILNVKSFRDCLFARYGEHLTDNPSNEHIEELFFFLEENCDIIEPHDNMTLCSLDDVKFVLLDDNDTLSVIILKKDKETIENFI